jgi:hypothetical protein
MKYLKYIEIKKHIRSDSPFVRFTSEMNCKLKERTCTLIEVVAYVEGLLVIISILIVNESHRA